MWRRSFQSPDLQIQACCLAVSHLCVQIQLLRETNSVKHRHNGRARAWLRLCRAATAQWTLCEDKEMSASLQLLIVSVIHGHFWRAALHPEPHASAALLDHGLVLVLFDRLILWLVVIATQSCHFGLSGHTRSM